MSVVGGAPDMDRPFGIGRPDPKRKSRNHCIAVQNHALAVALFARIGTEKSATLSKSWRNGNFSRRPALKYGLHREEFVELDATIWMILALAALILVIYAFHAARTHRMLARQFENQQKAIENQQKALDRQTEAMERIATALEKQTQQLPEMPTGTQVTS
jgi:hypothetical protein